MLKYGYFFVFLSHLLFELELQLSVLKLKVVKLLLVVSELFLQFLIVFFAGTQDGVALLRLFYLFWTLFEIF